MKTAIVLHHSLTADSDTVSWDAIRAYHMSWRYRGKSISEEAARELQSKGIRGVERPWREIGYHAGVERVNGVYRIMRGRAWNETAAAVKEGDMNRLGIHVCMIGNFDEMAVPESQWWHTVELVATIALEREIAIDRIFGHRDFTPSKSCPGRLVDMHVFRDDVGDVLRKWLSEGRK